MYCGVFLFFFKGVISGLIPASAPAGALLSAVRISMRGSAPGSGFSELLLGAVRPSRRCALLNRLLKLSSCFRGLPRGGRWTGWLPRDGMAVSEFPCSSPPPYIHVIRLAVPASMKALCWLPLLTSETWPAPWRWALTTRQEPPNRISKTLLWASLRCQIRDVAYTVAFCIK